MRQIEPMAACAACALPLHKPDGRDDPGWAIIWSDSGAIFHYWCFGPGKRDMLMRIERYAAEAWEAGL